MSRAILGFAELAFQSGVELDCALELLSAHLNWASSSVVPIIFYLKLQQKEYGRCKIDLKGE